jgi:phosphatidylinositol alpha-1,6-mannosyltransferase
MSQKLITLITLDYPPERGGVARYLGELVRASDGGIGTVIVEQNHALTGPGRVIPREFFWRAWPKWGPMIRVCMKQTGSRAILVSHVLPVGTAAMLAYWFTGIPYVIVCHGLDVRMAASNPWKEWLADLVFRNAELVIANSASTAATIKKITPELNPMVLTPGVHVAAMISKEEARVKLGIGADEEIILSVGRLIKRKGFDLLLEATEKLKDRENVRTVIIGDGQELPNLKQLAEHLKHRVTFITDAKDEDLALWYAAADLFCLPARESSTDVEGFGIVYLEAAAHGLPVLATNVGGVSEAVVDGETGILIPPDDAEKLAEELRRLLSDPQLRSLLGQTGRDRVSQDFTWTSRWERLNKALK